MNEKIRHLLEQIEALEDEIQIELNERRHQLFYQVHGKRVQFERSIMEAHRRLKVGLFKWILASRPQNYITAPIIYSMIVPLVIFDLGITFYQATCFPVYKIAQVKRSDYFAYDHRHLAYLNIVEKINCLYCSYGNGLMAYASEIIART
jgi:hypothetical protein